MLEQRYSDNEQSKRDIPSFIEPRPPLIQNPFMRPRPQKGTNLLELFEEDSELEEQELVQVYLRMKPCSVPNNLYEVRSERCLVTSMDTTTAGHGRRTQQNLSKMYTFSKIFGPECNQKAVFEEVVKDNLKKLPDGQSFTLLTYGASGSGKTYTLMGTVGSPGLVPRSLEYVFKLVEAAQHPLHKPSDSGAEKLSYIEQECEMQWVKKLRYVSAPLRDKYRRMSAQLRSDLTVSCVDLSNRTKHYVWVSFVEIYNEAIYDLLAPPEKRTKLHIREDSSGNVYVKGARQAFVRSGEEAYDVMVAGKHNLVVAATGVHAQSSRSHCIFTITMLTETEGEIRTSCVRLCDLAGCERARATRNTGTRMQESRAINSSLHVLERCLHVLRRNQRQRLDSLVPYRESKLTRLLGSGLSGARGEAVSMVVTLNPAPEFAHETKHVLSLAAVAQDIQINNTVFGSTTSLEISQNTTINSNAEIMKLRSDNERLHFELVQAQSRNKELTAAMEMKQQEAADTMRELVEEAKDLTRQYYEAQIQALRNEMEDMIEEYESRLAKAMAPPASNGTPSRCLQAKVTELMTEIAVLEEKLTEEHLARSRAEKEVQHLRTCIEERDEKAFKDIGTENDNLMSVTDSEHESDEEISDPLNESLEPMFKREEFNKTHALENDPQIAEYISEQDTDIDEVNKSGDTIKNIETGDETAKYSTCSSETSTINKTADEIHDNITINHSKTNFCDNYDEVQNNKIDDAHYFVAETKSIEEVKNESMDIQFNPLTHNETSSIEKETYDIDHKINTSADLDDTTKLKKLNFLRGTYFVKDTETERPDDSFVKKSNENEEKVISSSQKSIAICNVTNEFENTVKQKETLVNKIKRSLVNNQSSDSSLRQFEQLEMAARTCGDDSKNDASDFGEIKILTEKKTYFDDPKNKHNENIGNVSISKEKPLYFEENSKDEFSNDECETMNLKTCKEKRIFFDNIDVNIDAATNKKINEVILQNTDERSPSIVKENAANDFEPSTIKKLLGESLAKQPYVISPVHKNKFMKKHDSVDIFEGFDSPHITKVKSIVSNIEANRKSIEKLTLNEKIINSNIKLETIESFEKLKLETESSVVKQTKRPILNEHPNIKNEMKFEPVSSIEDANLNDQSTVEDTKEMPIPNEAREAQLTKVNSTIEEFENIYKDITAPRVTEFDLLVTHEINSLCEKDNISGCKEIEVETNEQEKEVPLQNKKPQKINTLCDKGDHNVCEEIEVDSNEQEKELQLENTKYNLRRTHTKVEKEEISNKKPIEEIIENQSKLESKTRRNLRLRRRKNVDESSDQDDKLKDIVNLQEEFSDVTMDMPATRKIIKDIPSPVKIDEGENVPPMMGIQSCPSKSITRSRRKLFTPRAEPLDESLGQAGDSNDRIYVPRPSYHRTRARRKL